MSSNVRPVSLVARVQTMSDSPDSGAMRKLRVDLIKGITDDMDGVYQEAIAQELVGGRSSATDKKGRATDLVTAVADRVEVDTDSDTSPMQTLMEILCKQPNLKYLAKKLENKRTNLERSESADFHAPSSTSSGIQHAFCRSSSADSYPGLGTGGSNPQYSQHVPQKFSYASQSHSSLDLEGEKQKLELYQKPIPVAEASSPMVPSSESVEDECQEREKKVQLASDRGSVYPTVLSGHICSEVVTKLKKEVDELKEENKHLSAKLLELENKCKEQENKIEKCTNECEEMRKRLLKLEEEVEMYKYKLDESESNNRKLESKLKDSENELEICQNYLQQKIKSERHFKNELVECEDKFEKEKKEKLEVERKLKNRERDLEICEKELKKRSENEYKLKIELIKCKNELKKKNEHELECQLKERKSS